MPLHVLTSDLLIADLNVRLADNPRMAGLVDEYGWRPGSKIVLSKEQFREFSDAVASHPVIPTPGGSSANTLTTLGRLLPGEVKGHFIGVAGDGQYSHMIRKSLADADIELTPDMPHGEMPQVAVSYVLVYPDGERTIATYPGNARDLLVPGLISEEKVADSDVVFVQGSLWQKIDRAFADRLLELRWKQGKQLWLALPTHAPADDKMREHFQYIIPSADVVLSNGEELMHVYGKNQLQDALVALQDAFRQDVLHARSKRGQVGFITLDRDGAAVVTKDQVIRIPPYIQQKEIVNKVGAGDTAFAGFLAGHIKNLPLDVAARIGVSLAEEKLRYHGARLPSPRTALEQSLPHIAEGLKGGGAAVGSRVGRVPGNDSRP